MVFFGGGEVVIVLSDQEQEAVSFFFFILHCSSFILYQWLWILDADIWGELSSGCLWIHLDGVFFGGDGTVKGGSLVQSLLLGLLGMESRRLREFKSFRG
jgi:hypothetical protein